MMNAPVCPYLPASKTQEIFNDASRDVVPD